MKSTFGYKNDSQNYKPANDSSNFLVRLENYIEVIHRWLSYRLKHLKNYTKGLRKFFIRVFKINKTQKLYVVTDLSLIPTMKSIREHAGVYCAIGDLSKAYDRTDIDPLHYKSEDIDRYFDWSHGQDLIRFHFL